MKKVSVPILFIYLILITNLNAQTKVELDSLYQLFLNIKGVETNLEKNYIEKGGEPIKCGLHLVNTLAFNLNSFTGEQRQNLELLLQRPSTTNSIISPSGKFKIHWNLSGPHSPSYDPNLLAQALDSVYRYQIEFLGYDFPPGDSVYNPNGSHGGDNKYDFYIQNLSGLYGYTQFEIEIIPGSNRYTGFSVIDNDFAGYFTSGINGARVTVAHEFHHAIQVGNYIFRPNDVYFYEITSTAMEEFVFDTINDYYAYMSDYFMNPSRPFPNNNGYNLAIWHIYLRDIYGFDIIKRQWELMVNKRAILANKESIEEFQADIKTVFLEFGIWSYFTNSRTIPGQYFKEAAHYPLLRPTATTTFTPPSQYYGLSVFPASNYYLKKTNSTNSDTIMTIIGNTDLDKTTGGSIISQPAAVILYNEDSSGIYKIGENYSLNFLADSNDVWDYLAILNDVVVSVENEIDHKPEVLILTQNYPNPFNPVTKISYALPNASMVDLKVYNVLGQLITTLVNEEKPAGFYEVDFNAADLPSGVYMYRLTAVPSGRQAGDYVQTRKMVLLK